MPPRSARRTTVKTCAAKKPSREDVDSVKCGAVSESSSKWCRSHGIQRRRLYETYQFCISALEAFSENRICQNANQIKACSTPGRFREWHKGLSEKCGLLVRCIEAHFYFSEHFPGNDLDFGHKAYLNNLKRQLSELQSLKRSVEVEGQKCILKSMHATWLLDEDYAFRHVNTCGTCPDGGKTRKLKPWVRIFNTGDLEAVHESDPVEREFKDSKSRAHLDLWTKLAFLCTPPESRFFDERLVVLITYLIRMVCGDPKLFLLSQNFSEMEEILSDSNLDESLSDKLFSYLDYPNPKQLRLAIEDVLRQKEESEDEHVVLLGRRLYRGSRKGPYPLHAWGHWLAFYPAECVCSVIALYNSFLARSSAHRLALIRQSYKSDLYPSQIHKDCAITSLCGMMAGHYSPLLHPEIHPPQLEVNDGKSRWIQRLYIPIFAASVSTEEPKASDFVNACLRYKYFNIILRKGLKGKVICHPSEVPEQLVREAATRDDLESAPWIPDIFANKGPGELFEIAQRPSLGTKYCDDSWYLGIYGDDKSTGMDLVNRVASIWMELYDVKDVFQLRDYWVETFVSDGEMERSADNDDGRPVLDVTDVHQGSLPRVIFPHLARYGLFDLQTFYQIVLGSSVPDLGMIQSIESNV